MDTQASDQLVGRLLDGRYRVGDKVARGGMATVYEALDTRLDRVVALKIMHVGLGHDADFSRKFVQEARSAARLSHPNVVAVFDQGADSETLFLAMEYVPGRTLREVIREQAPMPPARALDLLAPILSALSAAHDAGIVHRDIKPENVLIAADGTVKVADFGLSRAVSGDGNTATQGLLMGTVSYLAPELVTEGTADARSDVYSAGIVLYEMLTGVKPHTGETPIQVAYRHVHADVPPPSLLQPGLPPYIDALVQRSTARSRELRPADAHVFARQVRQVRSALDEGLPDDPELTGDLTVPILTSYEPGQFDDAPQPASRPAVNGTDKGVRSDTIVVEHDLPPVAPPSQPAPPPVRRPEQRKSRGPLAFLVVLLLAIGVGTGAWYYGIQRFTKTPNLVQLQAAQADAKARGLGLKTTISGQEYSETVAAGVVLSTDPGPGDRILKTGTIRLIVSKGKERYKVPALAGMDLSAAQDAIGRLNLTVGDQKQEYSESIAEGKVIASSPGPGTVVKRGAIVSLTISKGKKPISVPNYTGQRSRDATRALKKLGLVPVITREFSDTVEQGRVIKQDPTYGIRFSGDKIKLVVSNGPRMVPVPSVWRMNADRAQALLERAGFKVVVNRPPFGLDYNLVAGQTPGAGQVVKYGSVVTITVI